VVSETQNGTAKPWRHAVLTHQPLRAISPIYVQPTGNGDALSWAIRRKVCVLGFLTETSALQGGLVAQLESETR
jgi:hypothetical protein